MGFTKDEDKQSGAKRPIESLTLKEISAQLESFAQVLNFNASGVSERVASNYRHLSLWADMDADEYKRRKDAARANKTSIRVVSGAYTADGAIRMPMDDAGNFVFPTLDEILKYQDARLDRIAYAKQKEVDDLAKGWEPND